MHVDNYIRYSLYIRAYNMGECLNTLADSHSLVRHELSCKWSLVHTVMVHMVLFYEVHLK